MKDAEEIASRHRIQHSHFLAKKARAEALQSDIRSMQADLRIVAGELLGKIDAMQRSLHVLSGRLATHLRELDQEETTISLPALEPRDPRRETTRRSERRP